MAESFWTRDQITLIVRCVSERMNNPELKHRFSIEEDGHQIKIKSHTTVGSYSEDITIAVWKNSNRLYVGLGYNRDDITLSIWPWADTELKKFRRQILNFKIQQKRDAAAEVLYKYFPEAVTNEFEKQVLKDKE